MTCPDALQRSGALANRMQLQFGEIAHNQLIFVEAAAEFNDRSINSGSLIVQHEVFARLEVNPEVVGPLSQELWIQFLFQPPLQPLEDQLVEQLHLVPVIKVNLNLA